MSERGVKLLKEKIGLVTFYKDNFGSILQCYATKYIIEQLDCYCEVLCENKQDGEAKYIKKIRRIMFLIFNFLSDPMLYFRWKKVHNLPFPLTSKTWNDMDNFVNEVIQPVEYTWEELIEKGKMYKAFIVGSDQVWNAYNPIPPIQFLKFAPDNKKIAFAVSFGTDNPSKAFLKTIQKGIKGFKKISVREECGKRILKQVGYSKDVERIADPTLMLDASEWKNFCSDVKIAEENYILVHFLDYPNDIALKVIEKLREKTGLKILCIAYKYDVYKIHQWDYIDCNPREYVAFINKAFWVCTDSFHTTLFAINLGKEFFTFERQYLHAHPQTSRIMDLLKRFGLEDRYKKTVDNKTVSVVSSKNDMIERDRQIARDFLMKEIRTLDE